MVKELKLEEMAGVKLWGIGDPVLFDFPSYSLILPGAGRRHVVDSGGDKVWVSARGRRGLINCFGHRRQCTQGDKGHSCFEAVYNKLD